MEGLQRTSPQHQRLEFISTRLPEAQVTVTQWKEQVLICDLISNPADWAGLSIHPNFLCGPPTHITELFKQLETLYLGII